MKIRTDFSSQDVGVLGRTDRGDSSKFSPQASASEAAFSLLGSRGLQRENTRLDLVRSLSVRRDEVRNRSELDRAMRAPLLQKEALLHRIKEMDRGPVGVGKFVQLAKKIFFFSSKLKADEKATWTRVKEKVASDVCYLINKAELNHVYEKDLFDAVTVRLTLDEDPAIAAFCQKRKGDVNRCIKGAIKNAVALIDQLQQQRAVQQVTKTSVEREVAACQQGAFLRGLAWNEVKSDEDVKKHVEGVLCQSEQPGAQRPGKAEGKAQRKVEKLVAKAMATAPDYHLGPYGARFKKRLAEFTKIRAASGKVYELLNTLDGAENAAEVEGLRDKYGIVRQPDALNKHKIVLGGGGFGKVRLARDVATGEIVAVKKMRGEGDRGTALKEVAGYELAKEVGDDVGHQERRLVRLRDHAHLGPGAWEKSKGTIYKSYLFMDLAGGQTLCDKAGKKLDPAQLKKIAGECVMSVAMLHKRNVYHQDIKSQNFFIGKDSVSLGDFGTATQDAADGGYSGTYEYSPPEKNIKYVAGNYGYGAFPLRSVSGDAVESLVLGGLDQRFNPRQLCAEAPEAVKHDAFSLGMTLLELKNGRLYKQKQSSFGELSVTVGGQLNNIEVKCDDFYMGREDEPRLITGGLCGTECLKGDTLDEVIAKLLEIDPDKRITPTNALALPYFKELTTPS